MDRCWLQGALGDALHAISCAAGYNLRWLLRAIARLGIRAVFLHLMKAVYLLIGSQERHATCSTALSAHYFRECVLGSVA